MEERNLLVFTLKVCSTIAAEANEEADRRRTKDHARENTNRVIFVKFNEMKKCECFVYVIFMSKIYI